MLKRIIIAIISVPALVIGVFLALGGGFGEKPALPMTLQTMNRPILISHRGATGQSMEFPENTLTAFANAKTRGYRWIELDIQYSADSQFVVFHDKLGGSELPSIEIVSEATVSQLKNQPIVIFADPTKHTIPTLNEVITQFDTSLFYYFDMKTHGHSSVIALADDIAEFIGKHNLTDNAFVASHRVAFIAYLEYAHPEIITVLEGFNSQMASTLDYLPQNFKPDMIAGYQSTLDDSLVSFLRDSKMIQRYIAFHVDTANLRQTLDWGIQYIMVDDGAYVDSLLELQSR